MAKKRRREPEPSNGSSGASRRREEQSHGSKDYNGEELKLIKEHYLGRKAKKRHILKPSEKFSRIFAFDWEKDGMLKRIPLRTERRAKRRGGTSRG